MPAEGIQGLFENLRGSATSIAILTHRKADLDALGSSIALKRYMENLAPDSRVTITVPGGPAAYGERFLKAVDEKVQDWLDGEADIIFLLDTPTPDQLAPIDINEFKGVIAVIDHHAPHPGTSEVAEYYRVQEDVSSTAEVLFPYLKQFLKEDEKASLAMLVAIMADSGRLRYATNQTIHILSELLKISGLDIDGVSGFLEVQQDISRRMAHLKCAQRMELHRIGPWVISCSHIKAFGSSAAMSLLHLGADCALVVSYDGDRTAVHGRAKKEFLTVTGLHLGTDLMAELGDYLGGSGGGHAGAAGAKGRMNDPQDVLDRAMVILTNNIGS